MSCLAHKAPAPAPRRASRPAKIDLAALGHEIRSPLGTIPLIADLIDASGDENERRRLTAMIRLVAEQAMSVADDFLADGSRRLALAPVEIDPTVLVREIADLFTPALAAEGRRIEVVIEPRCPHEAVTDPTRLRQVLINLVTNAIRASGDSCVTIRVGRDKRRMRVAFSVEDDGPGLPPGFAIAPFAKGERSTGTGLGLWISSRIVRALGGSLEFAAMAPHGTAARFSIRRLLSSPRRPVPAGGEEADDTTSVDDVAARALVIDDSEVARQLMVTILESFDIDVATAANGDDAARQLDAERPDFVLLDWTLARESGADVIDRLAGTGQLPPIIVVSAARSRPADRRIAAFLRKPFSPRELYDTIVHVLEGEVRDAKA